LEFPIIDDTHPDLNVPDTGFDELKAQLNWRPPTYSSARGLLETLKMLEAKLKVRSGV
jgi:hypothetical protein